jgi:kumamolisin
MAPCARSQEVVAKPALGTVQLPLSSARRPLPLAAGYIRKARAFTNVQIFIPRVEVQPPTPEAGETTGYFIETPASISCIYGLAPTILGCNPNAVRTNSTGGSKVIAIVDAFDAPNIVGDLAAFSKRFNLPEAQLDVIFAAGTRPQAGQAEQDLAKGWELEESLDVEWAHAIAPSALIGLVEAASDSIDDLIKAEDSATKWVADHGGGEVSNSWGVTEFKQQIGQDFDGHFRANGVVYFAASGDSPGVTWPSTSPNVVCVGGTGILRSEAGEFVNEVAWSEAGAGRSQFETRPMFQKPLALQVGGVRACADVAAVADPQNGAGVWVYDSANSSAGTNKGWVALGGTSVATPIVAAMANLGGRFAANTQDELAFIYSNGKKLFDIKSGTCGPIGSTMSAGPGWDFCTGFGRPVKDAL